MKMNENSERSVFISHNHKDKPFVERLSKDLKRFGINSWIDESEMHFGESLVKKYQKP